MIAPERQDPRHRSVAALLCGTIASATLLPCRSAEAAPVEAPVVVPEADTHRALAESLFREGRRLMAEKKFAEACAKLAESQKLEPATGTLLNLGVCHVEIGRFARARVELRAALAAAEREGRLDRQAIARARLSDLEPRLAYVTLVVDEAARVPGLRVTLDGSELGPAAWGLAMALDPGEHELHVSAPGKEAWSKRLKLEKGAERQVVSITRLRTDEGVQSASGVVATSSAGPSPALRTTSYVLLGVGVASLGVGSYFGLRAYSQWGTHKERCPDAWCEDGADAYDAANRAGTIATWGFGVGLTALAAGTYLWFRTRSAPSDVPLSAASLSFAASPGDAGGGAVSLSGRW